MARTIRFHLDDHVDGAIADALRRRGIDVTTTPGAGLLSASDEEHVAFARSQGRVLFTQDTDFLRLHAAGTSHAGIVYCRQHAKPVGAIIRDLILVWEVLEPEDMRNRVEFL